MAKNEKTYLVKAQNYCDAKKSHLLGSYKSKDKAKYVADAFQKTLSSRLIKFKKEYCYFKEDDGIHKGWFFTIF